MKRLSSWRFLCWSCCFRLCGSFRQIVPTRYVFTALQMSNTSTKPSKVRILGLHGAEGDKDSFAELLGIWNQQLDSLELQSVTIDGPTRRGQGYAWWHLEPGERSSTVSSYPGFEKSQALVLEAMEGHGPFDFVVGHSQGAILLTALLATQALPRHPRRGYILNGVAWPNPYTESLEQLSSNALTDVHVLIIVGKQDRINPLEQALRVRDALTNAGAKVTLLEHPHGHSVPTRPDGTFDRVADWLVQHSVESKI